MSQDIEAQIARHMERETKKGHFEFTFNDIKEKISSGHSRGSVIQALAVMRQKKVLSTRDKGTTTFYYLTELQRIAQKHLHIELG